jgi:biopolymer transport protein ExbD
MGKEHEEQPQQEQERRCKITIEEQGSTTMKLQHTKLQERKSKLKQEWKRRRTTN